MILLISNILLKLNFNYFFFCFSSDDLGTHEIPEDDTPGADKLPNDSPVTHNRPTSGNVQSPSSPSTPKGPGGGFWAGLPYNVYSHEV